MQPGSTNPLNDPKDASEFPEQFLTPENIQKKGRFKSMFGRASRTSNASKQAYGEIDYSRSTTHRIFNLEKNQNTQIRLIRDCTFKYSTNKQGGREYSSKYLELKIEKHTSQQEDANDGKRIGYYKINLADFIDQPVRSVTYPMDNNGWMFMTVSLVVTVLSETKANDLSQRNLLQLTNSKFTQKKKQVTIKEQNSSEEEEEETNGKEHLKTYKHFYLNSTQTQQQQTDLLQKQITHLDTQIGVIQEESNSDSESSY